MLIGTIVFLLVVTCYVTWRLRREQAAKRKFEGVMPPPNQLSWKAPTGLAVATPNALELADQGGHGSDHASNWNVTAGPTEPGSGFRAADLFKDPVTWAAAADGAIPALMMAEALSKIDPQVIDALQFSTAQELHSLADIHSYVDAHFFDARYLSAEGWFERLTGYVAEQKAAAALEAAGHHVVFAPVANQPVWDLIVDGHPVQIKEGLAGVKDFIAQHPHTEVLTGSDVALIAKEHSVHGLRALDKDAIHSATNNTLDGIQDGFSPDFSFPVITLVFSSWREFNLLWNEKKTFDQAAAHVALDVGGVAAGGFGGAKIGALVGSIFPGFGTAIGAAIGGIVGAIGGKMASTGLRMSSFNSAREQYNARVREAQADLNVKIYSAQARIAATRDEYQHRFLEQRTEIETNTRASIEVVRSSFENELKLFCEAFPYFLQELESQLEAEEKATSSTIRGSGLLGILFPSDADLYRSAVRSWFRRARKTARAERRKFAAVKVRTTASLYEEIQRFLNEYLFDLSSLNDKLTEMQATLDSARAEVADIQNEASSKVTEMRDDLIKEFGSNAAEIQKQLVEVVRHWNSQISVYKAKLTREAAAVGIDLNPEEKKEKKSGCVDLRAMIEEQMSKAEAALAAKALAIE